jgi:hypothetical protein
VTLAARRRTGAHRPLRGTQSPPARKPLENPKLVRNSRVQLADRFRVPLAVITRLEAGQDLWRLAFYERDGERLRPCTAVECCWESVRITPKRRQSSLWWPIP